MNSIVELNSIKTQWRDAVLDFILRRDEHFFPLIDKLIDLIVLKITHDFEVSGKFSLSRENIEFFKDYSALTANTEFIEVVQEYLGLIDKSVAKKIDRYTSKPDKHHDIVYDYVLRGFGSYESKFKMLEEKINFEHQVPNLMSSHTKLPTKTSKI